MLDVIPNRAGLILSRSIRLPGERAAFFAAVQRGVFTRVTRGAYLSSATWATLDADDRYRMLLRAIADLAPSPPLFSHHSAAALWRLPWVGERPAQAHVLVGATAGGRSTTVVRRHGERSTAIGVEIEGLLATPLARTVVDLARVLPFGPAVAIADAALRRAVHPLAGVPPEAPTRPDLLAELAHVPRRSGAARAERVVHFADPAADRPGESLSRANMRLAGLPAPSLQVPIQGKSGRWWTVDFYWPEYRLIGEFDGRAKYTDPEFLRGRSPHDVLYEEKLREDDLRATGRGFARWPWRVALSPAALREHLVGAGLH